jgi:hypothetical protein
MTPMGSTRGMAHRWIDAGGLRLHCVEAGTGPLVVPLHGFPEFWYAWRHQLPAARRRRLPGGRARPTRLQHLRQAAPGPRLPTPAAGPGGGRPDHGPGRRLGHRRRPRLGRRAGLAAGHAPPRARPAAGGPQHAPSDEFPQGPGQPPPSCGAAGTCSPSSSPGCPSGSWRPGTSGRCAGPWVASRPARAPSPPRTSTAMSPPPPSRVPWVPPSTTAEPPSGPTRWPRRIPCVAWTSRPRSSGGPGPLPGPGAGRAGPCLGPGGAGRVDRRGQPLGAGRRP